MITDDEHLSRGAAAKAFLASSVFASVRDELRAEFTTAILESDFDDASGRERNFRLIRAFDLLEAALEARALIAEAVAERIEDAQTLIEEENERG